MTNKEIAMSDENFCKYGKSPYFFMQLKEF